MMTACTWTVDTAPGPATFVLRKAPSLSCRWLIQPCIPPGHPSAPLEKRPHSSPQSRPLSLGIRGQPWAAEPFLLALSALSLGMCQGGVLSSVSPESYLLDLPCVPVMAGVPSNEETTRKLISPGQCSPGPNHDNSKYNK